MATVAIYATAFSLPYPMAVGLAGPLLDFTKIGELSIGATLAFVAAGVALFALYVTGLRISRRLEGSPLGTLTVAGFGSLAALALLPMYPVFSLDVFYYMAADRIWSVYRENPFIVPPLQAAHDPFFPYTTWGHYPVPYGPLWPWISAVTSAFGGGEVPSTLLAFKALAVLGYLACLPLVSWGAAGFNPGRRLTALCIFAWNPLVLLELPGNAHNDAVALVPAALALGLWARRQSSLATLALATSFLIKATVLVLVPPLLWASFARAVSPSAQQSAISNQQNVGLYNLMTAASRIALGTFRWGSTHLLPVVVLFVLAWIPFWPPSRSVSFLRELDQHYQSLTSLLMAPVQPPWRPLALDLFQMIALIGFAVYGVTQLRWLASEGHTALLATWRLTVVYFLLVQPFYVGWYMIWPVLLSAMLADRRTTILTTLLCFGSLATHLVQFVFVPIAGPSLGLAQRTTLGVLAAFGPFTAGWAALTWRRAGRLPVPTFR